MKGDSSPFRFEGDERGVVCIHGFTASPFEMRYLGTELARAGMTVVGPALPGHTTTPADLSRTGWRDWYGAIGEAISSLQRRCSRIALVGQSLGGLLALRMAQDRGSELTAVASLAAPLWLTATGRAAVALTRRIPAIKTLPKTGIDIRDRALKRRIPTYSVIPVAPLHSLVELADSVHRRLGEIDIPTQVLHSRQDHTAPYECSEVIANRVATPFVRHRAFQRSYHLLSIDYERNIVAAEVLSFLEHHFSRGDHDEIRRFD